MDLSQLSIADLNALKRGDLSSVSSAGLRVISGQPTYGSGKSFDAVGGEAVPTGSPEAKAAQSPISGMSGGQLFAAGAGNAVYNLGRGLKQDVGLYSRKDVAAQRAQDAPLMGTSAGRWGDFTGNTAAFLPTAMIPGANTLTGAAAIGAASGLLQPSTSTGETLTNTGLGAALAPASILAGRAIGAVGRGAKAALWDPFTAPGQQRIASNVLQNFAGGPQEAQAAAAALQNMPSTLPGVLPTTAELAGNAGLAQLQKTLSSQPALMQDFTARAQGNRSALVNAVRGIAGSPADLNAAESARSVVTAPMYKAADPVQVPMDAELTRLLNRPSMEKAWSRAEQLAAERGDTLIKPSPPSALSGAAGSAFDTAPPQVSGKAIQYLKMGLNDLLDTADQKGIGSHEQNALKSTLASFNNWTMKNVPELRAADAAYQHLSGPINQMQVGTKLSDTLTPALTDFGQNTRLTANNFANAVRNGDQLTQRVTGMPLSLSDVLGSVHMDTIKKVGEQLARTANAAELGAPKGSPTAQNLISQNVMQQFLGPFGLPNNMAGRIAGSALGRTIARPGQLLFGAAEPDVTKLLAQAALDPQKAQGLLLAAPQNAALKKFGEALWKHQGLLGTGALGVQRSLADSAQQ